MKKYKEIETTNISNRKNKSNIRYNDYTDHITLPNSLSVYQSGHKNYCPPSFVCGPDLYNHYIIHFITSGSGHFTNSKGTYPIKTGDAFLMRPYETDTYRADAVTPWSYYWSGFTGGDGPFYLQACGFEEDDPIIHYPEAKQLVQEMRAIVTLELDGTARECILLGHLYHFFSLLIQNNQKNNTSSYADYYYKAIKYIGLNFDNPDLSVTEIADHVGLSRSHLYRVFYAVSKQSIQDCILEFRLKKATALLTNSTAAIEEIAYLSGFSNISYFSRMFKKIIHETPTSYRKNKAHHQISISKPS